MEAGRFDREVLEIRDSHPGKLFDEMPCIWLRPCRVEEYHPENCYACPCYKTSERRGTLSTT
eukprot:5321809-Prorocentrum_lima.AAC.1